MPIIGRPIIGHCLIGASLFAFFQRSSSEYWNCCTGVFMTDLVAVLAWLAIIALYCTVYCILLYDCAFVTFFIKGYLS